VAVAAAAASAAAAVVVAAAAAAFIVIIKYLRNIPGKHEIKELQTTATLGTAQYFGKCRCKSTKHSTKEVTYM
jgi:hypothetical protein